MNIIFEHGRPHSLDATGTKPDVKKDDNGADEAKAAKEAKITELKGILTEAGVTFNPRLGVDRLQALVDAIPVE